MWQNNFSLIIKLIKVQLRDYQKQIAEQGIETLRNFNIVYLAMQVRTGKTITSLEICKLYGAKKVLFVTKLKAISSIYKDFESINKPFDLYVTNYEGLHKVIEDFDLIVLDEAHSLGQYPKPSNRVEELKRLCKSKPIIYLSGTPTPESYSQFYHQLYVSTWSPFAEYKKFYDWHKVFGVHALKFIYNRQINDYSKTKKELIMERIEHLIISYTQEEAGFKCEVEEIFCKIPMSEKIKASIKLLKKNKIFKTKDGNVILADTAVKEMQKIHQICSGTVKDEEGNAIVFDTSKIDYIKSNFEGKKIAIFYKYIAEGTALKWHFIDRVIEDPIAFNKAGNDAIFISQIQSGREGINLSSADSLIMYNIDFSALSYWQGRARLQTLNRTESAKLYWLFIEGGIEEKIYKVVEGKKDFTLSHYKKVF